MQSFYSALKLIQFPLYAGVSAVTIAAGYGNTCIIEAGGGVKCWGATNYSILPGFSISVSYQTSPADIPGALHMHNTFVCFVAIDFTVQQE